MEHIGSITSRIAAKLKAAREGIQGADDAALADKKPARGAAGSFSDAHSGRNDPVDTAAEVLGRGARVAGTREGCHSRSAALQVVQGEHGTKELGTRESNQARMISIVSPPAARGRDAITPHVHGVPPKFINWTIAS